MKRCPTCGKPLSHEADGARWCGFCLMLWEFAP